MRSIKHECLNRMIFFGELHLRHVVEEYIEHHNMERPHKGLGYCRPVEPTEAASPVAKFLVKTGGGLHHLCFEVDEIEGMTDQLTKKGFTMVCEPVECVGYDRSFHRESTQPSKVAFLLLPNKILIEFLQKGA